MGFVDKDLLSIQEARILMEDAREARACMCNFSQEKLDLVVLALSAAARTLAPELAVMSAEETGYGNAQDKYIKNRFICDQLTEQLKHLKCVGILQEDDQLGTMDIGVPIGVVVALVPATSPVSTALANVLLAVKSGNPIVISAPQRAAGVVGRLMKQLQQAGAQAGLPDGAIGYLKTGTAAGTLTLLEHPVTAMIVNTGVKEFNQAAQKSGKPYLYGGTGNSPVFIERTADLERAVADLVTSRTFDYGIVSAAEQYVVVDRLVADQVKLELLKKQAYFMDQEEEKKLIELLCLETGKADPEIFGRPAAELASRAGFTVPLNTTVLISEQKYISDQNPFAKELLCPVLAYYIESDWVNACEKCINLLQQESCGHTLVIHSTDQAVIRQFALQKPVGRVLVNTSGTLGAMGATANLFPAMTLGSLSAGTGITAENISPQHFIYIRKVAYGVCLPEAVMALGASGNEMKWQEEQPDQDVRLLFKQILQVLSKELD